MTNSETIFYTGVDDLVLTPSSVRVRGPLSQASPAMEQLLSPYSSWDGVSTITSTLPTLHSRFDDLGQNSKFLSNKNDRWGERIWLSAKGTSATQGKPNDVRLALSPIHGH